MQQRRIQVLDQFHLTCNICIVGVLNFVANGHCGYKGIVALLGMGEKSWSLI